MKKYLFIALFAIALPAMAQEKSSVEKFLEGTEHEALAQDNEFVQMFNSAQAMLANRPKTKDAKLEDLELEDRMIQMYIMQAGSVAMKVQNDSSTDAGALYDAIEADAKEHLDKGDYKGLKMLIKMQRNALKQVQK